MKSLSPIPADPNAPIHPNDDEGSLAGKLGCDCPRGEAVWAMNENTGEIRYMTPEEFAALPKPE